MPASTSSSPPESPLWAVILAGGVGSRFWPASTPARPKQLLALSGGGALIAETVERIAPLVPPGRIRILAGAALRDPMAAALPTLGPDAFMIEPQARGTAPVLAWAAHALVREAPDAVMASLHADHVIAPAARFRDALATAARLAAREQRLFTLGAQPTRPETGYGYIRTGAALDDDAFIVSAFVEKPDLPTAQRYVDEGYLWNTGIFVWPAALLLDEIRRHTPELAELLPLLDAGRIDEFFARSPALTIDHGVLERSDRIGVLRVDFEWDDVGAWDALARTHEADVSGNVGIGRTHFVDAANCIAWGEGGDVVVFGAEDMIVVQANGITFVAPRERAADLKTLLAALPDHLARPEENA